MSLMHPGFDPVALAMGPVAIRWYALSYIVGIFGAWGYVRFMAQRPAKGPPVITPQQTEDFVTWAVLGIVFGGRLGYVLFYKPLYFLDHPQEIPFLWQGGMSFHGGLLGVILATVLFARRRAVSVGGLGDLLGCAAPIGLMLGRIGNFINGELHGRPAPPDLPWAMVFPQVDSLPRHPSQIYEALLEGALLLVVMHLLWRIRALRAREGALLGLFLIGYAAARGTAEFFREPDAHLGFLLGGATMGQGLSLPMVVIGALLVEEAWRHGRKRG
ncbi:MAG: phosphatidylglycerol:prolipoprotein diacylglycerol transferase [Rhodospirillaceae bacterium]|nr:MAG: phosphatidylglycerol:prolipoprotein diacylglycerol transferase [Rhodospirillaceae bacterium]